MKTQTVQTIVLSNKILIRAPVLFDKEIKETFKIINPAYTNSCKYGRSRFKPKKFLTFWKLTKEGISLPKGSLTIIENLYKEKGIKLSIIDQRNKHNKIEYKFKGELKESKGQLQIKEFEKDFGIVKAPTGSGKTVMFLWLLANKFKTPTIIVVHTNLLLNQWPKRINQFLGIPENEIGIIGNGLMRVKPLTIALMQTLVKHPKTLDSFGCLCIDECHRSPAKTYVKIIDSYKGKYLIGLSATPSRRDGLTNAMKWYLGSIDVDISLEKANLCKCYYKIVTTDFIAETCFKKNYSKALVELARNQDRNKLIIKNVLKYIEHPGIHLIISQNRTHCTKLFKMLPDHIRLISKILTGKVKGKERDNIVSLAEDNKLKFIFATDKLIGEGFDVDLLSIGHQTTPISDKNRLIQYVGRIRRTRKDKKYAIWFDYFDFNEPILRGGAKKRVQAYKENNITKL